MNDVVHWLVGLPTAVLFIGLMALGLLIAAGLSWLSSRVIEDDVRSRTSSSVTTVVGVIAALYAVLVAFVIVNEWQNYNDAQADVSNESAALSSVLFNASALPQPAFLDIQLAGLAYDRSIVCDELPYLADHEGPHPATVTSLRKLYRTVANVSPEAKSSPFYSATVDALSDAVKARRARINAASTRLPDLLLVVIFVTGLALVAAASVLDTQHRRWHLVLTTALTLLVSLNLALILSIDRPFDGSAKISDAALREGIPAAALRCGRPPTTPVTIASP